MSKVNAIPAIPLKQSPSPARISLLATAVICCVFTGIGWAFPEVMQVLLVKDFPGGAGAVEQYTEAFLFLALCAGIPLWIRHRRDFPDRLTRAWMGMWLLATFYFLGEEISWGQWWFGWDTPEAWAAWNEQETNLHNTSSWFSEKPKLMLELFIYAAGLQLPVVRKIVRRLPFTDPRWILPGLACVPPAAFLLISRLSRLFGSGIPVLEYLGDGEMKEMAIAWFFLWYVLGMCLMLVGRHSPERP